MALSSCVELRADGGCSRAFTACGRTPLWGGWWLKPLTTGVQSSGVHCQTECRPERWFGMTGCAEV